MHGNPLLKWLLIPMVLLLVFVGAKLFSGGDSGASAPLDATGQLTPEEMKALGIAGDTPRDTVATLVAQVRQLRTELQTALSDNRQHKAENERLRTREVAIDQRIQGALDSERRRLEQERSQAASDRLQTQGLMQELQRRLDGISGKGVASDLPIGLGLVDGNGRQFGDGGVRWVEPDDARTDAKGGASGNLLPSFPTSFGSASPELSAAADAVTGQAARAVGSTTKAVYTVPSNATLMGSVAMTALIGRVPIDGTVNDPYPFKVLIGADNLTANGIEIPEVAGAVVSGTASGDWTLSCVRGQIRSITFVFHDGTIRTVPEDDGNRGRSHRSTSLQDGLGWISDPYGIPCVSGERRSNAQQYLGSQALITAAGAGAASLIQSDDGSVAVVANSDGSLGTVGIGGNEAMGRILAGGVRDMADWVNKLYGQAFAAVYVQPGASVAVHLEQPLAIDYDAKGRRVSHQLGGAHAPDLD
ncbi:TIGR03752 family integrating conjugative element protein [Immundisolibacter sp.]|jgi:integrating conjugative element protein (TIGR03752 family)|uniref:TIGR03752 family integrating conjugative element protein n=1 Tax=Immundisolibacter sp. TaxID=1934948 RepID=UPI0026182649|nr:TIGR03752 family integrating conjugative element protein [Immundisolibacter sp.]MDD3652286.1 TIGR03752 family integrating conjugative element protein [Immundisolibacter sp.]MDX9716897.1 TIGR03752 family integrating conjugative element protein [Thauera sp.]